MAWTRISADRLAVLLGRLPTGVPAYQALAARVLTQEHLIYPRAIALVHNCPGRSN